VIGLLCGEFLVVSAIGLSAVEFGHGIDLGGGEIIVVLALVFMIVRTDMLPRIARWLWADDAQDAGRSFCGIYGKRGFQALTPDTRLAELYRPKLEPKHGWPKRRRAFFARLWSRMCRLIRRKSLRLRKVPVWPKRALRIAIHES